MRDDYLGSFWADHHGLWTNFLDGAIRLATASPTDIVRRSRRQGPDRRGPACGES